MKRNKVMQKAYKGCLQELDNMLGEQDAGLLVAIMLKLLKKNLGEKEILNLRTIEIKVNDYFSSKWDFEKGDFVNE